MALSDGDLRALKPKDARYRQSVGDSLYVEVYPTGGKYFLWNYRFPPGRKGQQRWYQIGPYGKSSGQWTLTKARQEKDRLDVLRREGEDPRLLKSEQKVILQGTKTVVLRKVADEWLGSVSKKLAASTLKDYRNKLQSEIFPSFGTRSIKTITRGECLEFKRRIEARGAKSHSDKVFGVLRQIFEYAIDLEWLEEPNPARSSRQTQSGHVQRSYPSLEWDEVPKFLDDLAINNGNGDLITWNAVKVLLLTFMRVGGVVPAKWSEVDFKKEIWTIPAERMKGKQSTKTDHLIPIAPPLMDLLEKIKGITGHSEYLFLSPRGKSTEHISLESPNHLIKRMGYQGKLVAHGVRHMALTFGQDILKTPFHVIDLQMGHKPPGRVRQSYDKAQYLDERKVFMAKWADLLLEKGLVI